MRLLGAILAGGRSRRFGSDKALADFQGRPMIEHAIAAIAHVTERTVVSGRLDAPASLTTIPDWPASDQGPLGGICGALRYALANGYDAVLTLPCDTPLLPPGLIARVAGATPAFVAQSPVIGCWPANLADTLANRLQTDPDRSVVGWARTVGAQAIDAAGDVPNVNRPADLAALRSR